jgi:DNA-binding transcriptional LysR family regulator
VQQQGVKFVTSQAFRRHRRNARKCRRLRPVAGPNRTRPTSRGRRPVALAVCAAAAVIALAGCTDIVVYGDSLTAQSSAQIQTNAGGKSVVVRAGPGTALCDWVPQMAADRATEHPKTVVIAFAGNVGTCVASAWAKGGAAAAVANYEAALRAVRRAYPTERIIVVGAVAARNQPGWAAFVGNPQLNAMYQRVAAQIGATYSPWADWTLTPGHVYADKRPPFPCLASDTGKCAPVLVRTADGVHLTPEGARWYGWALAFDASRS